MVLTATLLMALAGYGQAYGIDSSRPVNVADVKVTAVNNAYFTEEGIVVVRKKGAKRLLFVNQRGIRRRGFGSGSAFQVSLTSRDR